MLISELSIGQNVTVGYWFDRPYSGHDYAIVTGTVRKKLECYGSVELEVTDSQGGYSWKYLWVNDKSELISINN